jgi:hypothetical protein
MVTSSLDDHITRWARHQGCHLALSLTQLGDPIPRCPCGEGGKEGRRERKGGERGREKREGERERGREERERGREG